MGLRAVGLALIVLVAAGCDLMFPPGAGPVRDGAIGDDAVSDAETQPADAPELPDARIDGAMGVDIDGDGVDDATDNCPELYNPMQRDKDGDAAGDQCDPCPHLPGITGADLDSDGDQVGNGCDPRPAVSGETMVFYGFYDGTEINAWVQNPPGLWSSGGGVLVQSTNAAPSAQIYTDRVVDRGRLTIGVRGTDQIGGNLDHFIATITGSSGLDFHQCQASVPVGSDGALRLVQSTGGNEQTQTEPWPGTLLFTDITLSATMKAATYECFVRTEPSSDPTAGIVDLGTLSGGLVGLQTHHLAVEVSYLFIASSP